MAFLPRGNLDFALGNHRFSRGKRSFPSENAKKTDHLYFSLDKG